MTTREELASNFNKRRDLLMERFKAEIQSSPEELHDKIYEKYLRKLENSNALYLTKFRLLTVAEEITKARRSY